MSTVRRRLDLDSALPYGREWGGLFVKAAPKGRDIRDETLKKFLDRTQAVRRDLFRCADDIDRHGR